MPRTALRRFLGLGISQVPLPGRAVLPEVWQGYRHVDLLFAR